MSDLQYSVAEAKTVCALRFKGYDYEQSIAPSNGLGKHLSTLIQPIVDELILHPSNNDNFAAFFGLQRFLCKWGGEYLPESSKEPIAYRFLFLHLYSQDPPEPFRNDDYCSQWQEEFLPQIESIAAIVRRELVLQIQNSIGE